MNNLAVREPFVAGQFYPASSRELKINIDSLVDKNAKKVNAIGCMLPHAGYVYSGKVAAETVSRINIPDTIILLGPNHTGSGQPFSIMTEGVWNMPFANVSIDASFAKDILNNSCLLKEDTLAHTNEHSLEVELPFFQYFKENFKIVPIVISSGDNKELKKLGDELAAAIINSNAKDKVLIVASSDMTHYEPLIDAQKKDKEAIDAIIGLDEDKLMQRIRELDITMCGYAPAITMLKAAKALGAKKAELVKYQTSADATGDKGSVVGYAGVIIY